MGGAELGTGQLECGDEVICKNSHTDNLTRDTHNQANGADCQDYPAVKEREPAGGKREVV